MPNSNRQVHDTSLQSYHHNNLIKAVDRLVCFHEIKHLSEMLADLIYFLSHPECADDFEKQSIIDHAVDCMNVLGDLSDLYGCYNALKNYRYHE